MTPRHNSPRSPSRKLHHDVEPIYGGRHEASERMVSVKRADACTPAAFYTYPTVSSIVDATKPVVFKWSTTTSCPTSSKVDLTLYAPDAQAPVIKVVKNVNFADGQYSIQLLPKWWNSMSQVKLQMSITQSGSDLPSYLSENPPAGPAFSVTYPEELLVTTTDGGSTVAAKAADTAIPDQIVVTAASSKPKGLSPGSIFAATFFPIAIVIAGIFLYIWFARSKQAKKRQRFSVHVDKRMSVISTSWQPGDPNGPGTPRKSNAFSNRRSTFHSAEGGRNSMYNNMAGRGATNNYADGPEMVEVDPATFARPRTHYANEENRTSMRTVSFVESPLSRLSFAAGATAATASPRQSAFAKPERPSISTHGMSGLGGPSETWPESLEMALSPDQIAGARSLGQADVDRWSIVGGGSSPSVSESKELSEMAAVRLMDRPTSILTNAPSMYSPSPANTFGRSTSASVAAAAGTPMPAVQLPTEPAPTVSSFFPTSLVSAQSGLTSPDEALRRHALGQSTPTANLPSMLSATAGPRNTLSVAGDNNPFRQSMLSDISRYSGVDSEGENSLGQAK